MHVQLRKKEYDFTLADAACNRSFSILRQREGNGDVTEGEDHAAEAKQTFGSEANGATQSAANLSDLKNGADMAEAGCDDETKTVGKEAGCDSETKAGVAEAGGVDEAKAELVNGEPPVKKVKLEDMSKLGPVSEEDLVPLKPRVRRFIYICICFFRFSGKAVCFSTGMYAGISIF
jgi:hypothetical protein